MARRVLPSVEIGNSTIHLTDDEGSMDQMLNRVQNEDGAIGYLLLWLIGIPLPLLIILFLIFR